MLFRSETPQQPSAFREPITVAPHVPQSLPRHPHDAIRTHAPAQAPAAKPAPSSGPIRPDEPSRRRDEHDDGPTAPGLGDHMPAFLTRGRRAG